MLSTKSNLDQLKIGSNKLTTRFYLDITQFSLISIAFIPLVPKFIVWYTTNELLLDKTFILFKLCFAISLIQLHFLAYQQDKR